MTAPKTDAPHSIAASEAPGESTAAIIVADVRRSDKDDITLIATGALAGCELRKLANGRWLVSRWNLLHREFDDASAVRAFLASAGVRE